MVVRLKLEPLGVLGATVRDVDLNHLDQASTSALRQALLDHQVLFFHDQQMEPETLLAAAGRFGNPVPYPFVEGLPDYPEVIEVIKQPEDTLNFGGVWHSDTAYLPSPAKGALLYAKEVPNQGGDTMFTSMRDVLSSLSPGLRTLLGKLTAINDADNEAISATRPSHLKKNLRAEHPVICRHPETGEEYLFVNRAHTTHFGGMTRAESQPLLDYLFQHIEQPEFSIRFHWQTGSVAFWDNRACQHYPLNDYQGSRRHMLRVSLEGEAPLPSQSFSSRKYPS